MESVILLISKKVLVPLVLVLLLFNCFGVFRSEAQLLLDEEVQALRVISTKLNNTYWNVDENFCNGGKGSNRTIDNIALTNVSCDCSHNNFSVCHVTNIQLRRLNLTGVLPEEFSKLRYLQEIDLANNYIGGSIPKSWASLPLVTLTILGSRISGSIPKEIGNITTLENLILENNHLEGPIPPELGKLSRLKKFVVSANNFTKTLPTTLGNLKNLTEFRIDGTNISGRIPDFIGNWTQLNILDLQGTLMEGPFPSTISLLKSLTNLRVSDLNGPSMDFPGLQGMKDMRELVLRNSKITGPIPQYIGETMMNLKTLDLSFNRLIDEIPPNLQGLSKINFMYLNENALTREIPSWILTSKRYIDISYNNFTGSSISSCQQSNVKYIASYSSSDDNSISWCLRKNLPCTKKPKYYELFINCGGKKLPFEGKEYEQDLATMGPSYFFSSERWASSSTGSPLSNDKANFVATNISALNMSDPDLYMTARITPVSLKYYGLCLRKGSYKVRLHFAEIMFTSDQTFSSLGKRFFDVSIQGERVLKDFNIVEEAGGVGKGITRDFDALVTGSTLEIHLFWSGKGTTTIPNKGVHGPLISAITVTPNFDPHTGLSVGAIVGIAVASCAVIVSALAFIWIKCYMRRRNLKFKELRGLELQPGYFSLRRIKAATGNFDPANKIGEGGFGSVYKGTLSDGTMIAVKQLSSKSKQGNREFLNEISMISALQHPNLVKLYGCSIDGNQLFLVYEYMENNCLALALFGREEHRLNLDWSTRHKICLGIAKGLAYLHEESTLKMVHRDIKATNVLLDEDFNAKISDFGLAKLDDDDNTHISTRIAGTIGYMAPEYAMRGYLTNKADVYSFGVVALEIVSGQSNTNYMPKEEFIYLLDWAYVVQEQGSLLELVDPRLGLNYSKEEALQMLNLALLCTNPSPTLRPTMSSVVSILEGKMTVQAHLVNRGSLKENRLELSHDSQTDISRFSSDSQIEITQSTEESWSHSTFSKEVIRCP